MVHDPVKSKCFRPPVSTSSASHSSVIVVEEGHTCEAVELVHSHSSSTHKAEELKSNVKKAATRIEEGTSRVNTESPVTKKNAVRSAVLKWKNTDSKRLPKLVKPRSFRDIGVRNVGRHSNVISKAFTFLRNRAARPTSTPIMIANVADKEDVETHNKSTRSQSYKEPSLPSTSDDVQIPVSQFISSFRDDEEEDTRCDDDDQERISLTGDISSSFSDNSSSSEDLDNEESYQESATESCRSMASLGISISEGTNMSAPVDPFGYMESEFDRSSSDQSVDAK